MPRRGSNFRLVCTLRTVFLPMSTIPSDSLSASRRHILFLGCLLLLLCSPHVQARPIFVLMDMDQADQLPAQIGYQLRATHERDKTRFTVDLDANSSAAFESASLFYMHPALPPPEIHVDVTHQPDNESAIRLTFMVPTAAIADWYLQVRSGPLRSQDNRHNFYAYRFRLDNVPLREPVR